MNAEIRKILIGYKVFGIAFGIVGGVIGFISLLAWAGKNHPAVLWTILGIIVFGFVNLACWMVGDVLD